MAVRRKNQRAAEQRTGVAEEPGATGTIGTVDDQATASAARQPSDGKGSVRPEVLAIGRKVIAARRGLLDRLAEYDRGDAAER